jgi:hypothetical protein
VIKNPDWNFVIMKLVKRKDELGQLIGIALGYGLDGGGIRVPVGAGNFSPHHRVQTGSWAHPTSYPVDTKGYFPGGKAARA